MSGHKKKVVAPINQRVGDLSGLSDIGFKCTVIYDNRLADAALREGFGFSCFIEWNNQRFLFDTGGNKAAFLENIKKLNISIDTVTHMIYSHQHWDHTAGFEEILKRLPNNTKLYLPAKFSSKFIKKIPHQIEFNMINNFLKIAENIYSLVLKGSSLGIDECFSLYEQAIIFDTSKGLVILTGCGHPGIVNIIEKATTLLPDRPIYLVIGGLHLHNSFSATSQKIVEKLKFFGAMKVAPCHCTGETASKQFQKAYGKDYYEIGTGSVLHL